MAAPKTDWLLPTQHPVRDGWYERDYSTTRIGGVHLDLWQQRSPGDGYWYVEEPKGQINDAYYEHLPWRGLNGST